VLTLISSFFKGLILKAYFLRFPLEIVQFLLHMFMFVGYKAYVICIFHIFQCLSQPPS
jgi:hypothetical protein